MTNPITLPPVQLDLHYLETLPGNRRSPAETEALTIAKRDGDTYLEWTDFAGADKCRNDAACTQRFLSQLWGYREKLILNMTPLAQELVKIWPDLKLSDLTTLITREATHVSDLAAMTRRLVRAIEQHPTLRDSVAKRVLLFSRTWLIVYNFGEAHRMWVKQGHKPIKELPVEKFVSDTLKRLEHGGIEIGASTLFAVAGMYDHDSDTFSYNEKYVKNPLYIAQSENGEAHSTNLILHELFHAERDARAKPVRLVVDEVAATLLGYKGLIVVHGESAATEITRTTTMHAKRWAPFLKSAKDIGGILTLLNECLSPLVSLIPEFEWNAFTLARRELELGRVDAKQRLRLEHEYAKGRLLHELLGIIVVYIERDVAKMRSLGDETFDDDQFVRWANSKYETLTREGSSTAVPSKPKDDTEMVKLAFELLHKRVNRLFHSYYTDRALTAKSCEGQFTDTLTDLVLTKIFKKIANRYDGLSKLAK